MPELRKDPILGRWIIIAKERSKRPTDFAVDTPVTTGGFCPLCPENEKTTPSEVLVYGRDPHLPPNSSGWKLRVVPNKYPALVIEANRGTLTPAQIRAILEQSADDLGKPGNDDFYGAGRVNALRAVLQ